MFELLDLTDTAAYDVVRAIMLWTAIPTFLYFLAINLTYAMLMLMG